ncbi:MAG TPA: arginine--tRNA ligase [Candidatus Paceibacterota bacterium]|nr:arginine--tRNA ligase [Verrucomicrobiota bacterium]HRZ46386.1 arginine--tRNA ligase [Candidatus Paceibacterota bacterium]
MYEELERRLRRAVEAEMPAAPVLDILVRPCAEARFGDYQTNSLIGLGKRLGCDSRQLAARVRDRMDCSDLCEAVDVVGAGFLNFKVRDEAVARELAEAQAGRHLFFRKAEKPRTIVVDFSSPNVAKPMHVGHIRSTILGDCLARVFRRLGHRVIKDNHVGDWGTQFGKLLVGWKERSGAARMQGDRLAEMERLYKEVNQACESDPAVLEAARQELVKLQQGDPENLALWRHMRDVSMEQFEIIYRRMGIEFDATLGESFYRDRLAGIVADLQAQGLAQESEGAMVVFFEDDPELKAHPAIILKRDGASNYTTTDLATIEHRLREWAPDEIVYVTDGRQQLHFRQLFAVFRRWHPESKVDLRHIWFGSILGEDGKPFKTRSGEVIKLADLLDEAEDRAYRVVSDKNPGLSEAAKREIGRVVGIGAIKYADLLPNRQSDYVFSWDKMLSLTGNTAPYLLYAYTRIRSIFRKMEEGPEAAAAAAGLRFDLGAAEESRLARHLLNFGFVLEQVAAECRPNYLCNYLYDLAGHFNRFFESCPVLQSEGVQRASRVALCGLTARVLREGLDALGLETTDQM